MSNKIPNHRNSPMPKYGDDSVDEHNFSNDFDPKAEGDGAIISSKNPKNIGQFIWKLIHSTWKDISNLFQLAKDNIKNKFTDYLGSRALTNVRQNPALSVGKDIKNNSAVIFENSHNSDDRSSESAAIRDENFGGITQDENLTKITSKNIDKNKNYLKDFEEFKKYYELYKAGKISSIDNLKLKMQRNMLIR